MPEDKNLLHPTRSSSHHKKKKKKGAPTAPENKEKHLAVSSAPDTSPVSMLSHPNLGPSEERLPKLRAFSKKDRKPCTGSGQKTKRCHRDSQSLKNDSPAQVTELSFQTRESLRWEGVLQDPQEEAKRLELYRTNRRQRYIVQSIKRNPARLETDFS